MGGVGSGGHNKAPRGRDLGIIRRYQNGETLAAIGKDLGLTRERVRQILWREVGRDGVEKARDDRRSLLAAIRRPIPSSNCLVCLRAIPERPHRHSKTCSKQCAEDYRIARYHLDPVHRQNQRLRTADWILRHPERVKPNVLRYNQKIADGATIKERGHWMVQGSKVHEVMTRIMRARHQNSGDWSIDFPQPAEDISVA